MHHRINFHCFAICCTDGRTHGRTLHGRTLHGRTDARTDDLTRRLPFVRHYYWRIAITIQLYLVFVIVCVMKEIIFLLSKTPLSSGSGHTRSYRYLTDYHIIGVCLYLFVVACTFSLVRWTVLDGEMSGDMITVIFYLVSKFTFYFISEIFTLL